VSTSSVNASVSTLNGCSCPEKRAVFVGNVPASRSAPCSAEKLANWYDMPNETRPLPLRSDRSL
jgi:hypothetical protein